MEDKITQIRTGCFVISHHNTNFKGFGEKRIGRNGTAYSDLRFHLFLPLLMLVASDNVLQAQWHHPSCTPLLRQKERDANRTFARGGLAIEREKGRKTKKVTLGAELLDLCSFSILGV